MEPSVASFSNLGLQELMSDIIVCVRMNTDIEQNSLETADMNKFGACG